jgi:hypothetical protein
MLGYKIPFGYRYEGGISLGSVCSEITDRLNHVDSLLIIY